MVKFTRTNDSFLEKATEFLLVKVLGFGQNDVQTPNQSAPAGIDSNPIKNMIAIQAESSVSGESVVIGYLQKSIAEKGEVHLFSTDENGTEKFRIKVLNTGICEIGGNSDFAVRYSKTAESVNELKNDLNDLKQIFSSWVTVPNDGGAALKTLLATYSTTPISKDIAAAKIDEIKVS